MKIEKLYREKKFKFKRKYVTIFIAMLLIADIFLNFDIIIRPYTFNLRSFIISQLIILGFIGFWFIFYIFVIFADIAVTKKGLEITYLSWYTFKVPKRIYIPFKDIISIKRMPNIRPFFDSTKIATRKISVTIFDISLGNFLDFLKLLLSKVPKKCEIKGFETEKRKDGKILIKAFDKVLAER